MDETFLYRRIAESIRQEILEGTLRPGDRLPSVREVTVQWHCTPGTVQRAYQALARQGLIVSRAGQGTHVAQEITISVDKEMPLRRANLVHRAEAFLLEVLTAGHTPEEAERAVRLALDRWRSLSAEPVGPPDNVQRFVGSHDPSIALIASISPEIAPGYTLQLTFVGSLGGLIALAKGEADLAGSHLWDQETDTYNAPFVRRLLPNRRVALVTLANRRLGFLAPAGNPLDIRRLEDLARPGVRMVNRQAGSGTRVWLDAQIHRLNLPPSRMSGYENEVSTHSEVARIIAEGNADAGLGVESAAMAYGLEFVPLTTERYDLVIPGETWDYPPIQALARWLATGEARSSIAALGGYGTEETGRIQWVE